MSVSTMKKLTVLAYRNDADAIVRKLMRLRCVEIRQAGNEGGLLPTDTYRNDSQRAEAEKRVAAIQKALPILAKYTTRKRGLGRFVHRVDRSRFLADGRGERAFLAVEQALQALARIEELTAEKTRLEALIESLEPWLAYDAPLNANESARTVTMLGSLPLKVATPALREELETLGAYTEAVGADEYGAYFTVTSLKEHAEELERHLVAKGFVKECFSDIDTTANAASAKAEARLSELDAEMLRMEETQRELAELLDDVEILYDIEATTVKVCEQKRKLAETRNCVILQGWIPSDAEDAVTRTLSGFECACELAMPEEGDEVPVLLKNNSFAATFEWVIGMYSYPKYGTYDPTWIMSIFYFIIFGLMFADVGYGLLLVIGCFGGIKLLNPRDGMKRMMMMFGYCGISCMVMGVLFGGWFGNLPTAIMNSFIYHQSGVAETTPIGKFFANGLIFNPIDSSTSFLVLSLALGEIHLIAGMAINMVQTIKSGRVAQGLCSTLPFWVLFAGIDLLAPKIIVDMLVSDPSSMAPSTLTLFANLSTVGTYMMFAGFGLILLLNGVGQKSFGGWLVKGLGGLYSLISFASDLLSYSRILALGLVAGVIAQVINMLTGLGAGSVIGFVFMLIVMVLGHVLNLAINLLGTFVHAARLQYIEFFGKFYEDGGEPFTPVLPIEEYSEDCSDVPN